MLNPDGYEANRRGNGNNADLNRDFPTVTGGSGGYPVGLGLTSDAVLAAVPKRDVASDLPTARGLSGTLLPPMRDQYAVIFNPPKNIGRHYRPKFRLSSSFSSSPFFFIF